MKDDYTANSHYGSLIHFSFKGWENLHFELGSYRLQIVRLLPNCHWTKSNACRAPGSRRGGPGLPCRSPILVSRTSFHAPRTESSHALLSEPLAHDSIQKWIDRRRQERHDAVEEVELSGKRRSPSGRVDNVRDPDRQPADRETEQHSHEGLRYPDLPYAGCLGNAAGSGQLARAPFDFLEDLG